MITVVTGAGALILGSFKAFVVLLILILTFFRFELANWWDSDRSPNQYYLLAR